MQLTTANRIRLAIGHWFARWVIYPICYYIVRYRRWVVRENLRLAFPDKDKKARKRIERLFYRSFADVIIETVVGRHFTPAEMNTRLILHNLEQVHEATQQYGGCFMMIGHFMNWEWLGNYADQITQLGTPCGTIYKQLSSPFFDKLMLRLRKIQGAEMIEMKQLLRVMVKNKKEHRAMAYAMLADQRPRKNAEHYQTTLLGQQVSVLTGTEQLAVKFQYPVFYCNIHIIGRGEYEGSFLPIWTPADGEQPFGTITERYTRLLETNIQQEPAHWLWSHNRFKLNKK